MKFGQLFVWISLSCLALPLTSCSSGGGSGGGGGGITVASAVQDLTVDPEGKTTVVSFSGDPATVTAANFESSGGQTAQSVVINGNSVTVVWDESLGSDDEIRIINLAGFSGGFAGVTSTDMSAPSIQSLSGTQNVGLGGDIISVQFTGPYVDEGSAEDLTNWTLETNGETLDLTGSSFDLTPATQILEITLGSLANIHSSFDLTPVTVTSVADVPLAADTSTGAAAGDLAAPTIVSVTQRLDLDEFGRVLEFTFNEAMDPIASPVLPNFGVTLPDTPTTVEQIMPAGDTLQVTFNQPQVPGINQINLAGLIDAHGNPFAAGMQAITATEPVAGVVNAYDISLGNEPVALTVPNEGGDSLIFKTTQAFDPDSAADPNSWTLTVDGAPVIMADQSLTYDFLEKELTIDLDFDMPTGVAFVLTGVNTIDVDGQTFALVHNGTVSGDSAAPSASGSVQNRTQDPSGVTVDVSFDEDLDETSAELLANWAATGGLVVTGAELLAGQDLVRLTLDGAVEPGATTLTATAIEDLAGNAMAAQAGIAITSNDSTAPTPLSSAANAIEGALNDTVVVIFSDDMIESEVEDPTNWTIESPIGVSMDTTGSSVSYESGVRRATFEFDGLLGQDFKGSDSFNVTLSTMRDLGGNAVTNVTLAGMVTSEKTLPNVDTIWRVGAPGDEVSIFFTEPCDELDDLYSAGVNPDGTRYVLRDNLGVEKAKGADAVALSNGLGVRVGFSVPVLATDTIDVIQLTDLAGNEMFPQMAVPTVAADATVPSLAAGTSTFVPVSGERNDVITVVFDRPMNPFEILRDENYSFNPGINLDQAQLEFDGTDTVTITLDGAAADALIQGDPYDLSVVNVNSAQGVSRTITETELAIAASGDNTPPDVLAGNIKQDATNADALIYETTEALDDLTIFQYGNFQYQGVTASIQAFSLNSTTVRLIFPTNTLPAIGQTVNMEFLDAAGNTSGVITRAITAADAVEPGLDDVAAVSVPGQGGDYLEIDWNESMDLTSALDISNYSISTMAGPVDLTGAEARYFSDTQTVRIALAGGVDLDTALTVDFSISNVADVAGNTLSGTVQLSKAVTGDLVPPSISNAFSNLRFDPLGRTVDVLFDEDVDETFATTVLFWSTSGAASVTNAEMLGRDRVRLTLDAALALSDEISLGTGLEDAAGNAQTVATPLTIEPVL